MSEPVSNNRKSRRTGFLLGLLIGLAAGAAIVFLVTGLVDANRPQGDGLVEQARSTIEKHYWRAVPADDLDRASVEGMVERLREEFDDEFTYYFDPEHYENFKQSTSGSFSGVGMTVVEAKQGLRVVGLMPDSPAQKAGITEGELITHVDGESIAGMPSTEATELIKGPEGTEVTLTVVTPADISDSGKKEIRELQVERADVRVPAVQGELIDAGDGVEVGYILFHTFSRGAGEELRAETERLLEEGAAGLVIDMRGNGGGLFQEAVSASRVFVDEGLIVTTSARARGERSYSGDGSALDIDVPVLVLVDADTASASEIFAAALADNDVATIVGKETFGKGVFQEVIGLPAGGALDLTVGEFFTPEGVSLAGDGIDPDIEVDDDPKTRDRDEALRRALEEFEAQIKRGN